MSQSANLLRLNRIESVFRAVAIIFFVLYFAVHIVLEILSVLLPSYNVAFDMFFGLSFGFSAIIVCVLAVVFGLKVHFMLGSLPMKERKLSKV